MKKQIIMILIPTILLISLLAISSRFEKKENIIEEETTTSEETVPLSTTTTTTTTKKTTKKTTKNTTRRTTMKAKTATGSKAEYLAYAKSYGNLNDTQLNCLDYLWTHESGWNPNSVNKSSGACGIPQAYPCKKIIQSEGTNDWKAQIRWGIKYINYRYKNPCAAWNHFKNKRWY